MAKVPVEIRVNAVDGVTSKLAKIEASLAGFSSRLMVVQKSFGETQKRFEGLTKAAQLIGGGMQSAGRAMTFGVTLPVVALGASIIKTAGDFEAAMNNLRAKTGATREDLVLLKETARAIGRDTQFSASEAASAMVELGKAGFNTAQIMDGTKSVMALAGSENMDLASAATIVADTMSQFGLKASDTARIVDTLSKAANISTTDVVGLAEGLSYAGGIARANNISLEETTAVLGVFANAGVKGSRAGTALATGINRISANPKAIKTLQSLGISANKIFDGKDKLGSFIRLIKVLETAKPSQMQLTRIFGEEAGRSIVQLIGKSNDLKQSLDSLSNSKGFADEQMKIRMQGYAGSVKELESAFEDLKLELAAGGFLDAVTEALKGIKEMIQSFQGLSPETKKFIVNFVLALAVMGPVIFMLGSIVSTIATVFPMFMMLGKGLGFLKFAFLGLLKPIGTAFAAMMASPAGVVILGLVALVAALAAVGYGIYKLWQNWDQVWDWMKEKGEAFISWFSEGMADIGRMFKGDFSGLKFGAFKKPEGSSLLGPMGARPTFGAPLPVQSMVTQFMPNQKVQNSSEVTVNFENMPRGVRVQEERGGSAPLKMNLGYMMGGG